MEIDEAKLKDILSEQRTLFQHQVGIFKEDLESQIKTIGEHLGSISEDVSVIKSDIEIMKSDIDIIKVELHRKVDYDEFYALAKRVAALEAKSRK